MANRNADDGGWLFGMAIFAGGWLALGCQIYWFLRENIWTPWSVLELLQTIGKPGGWLFNPQSWLGLHATLDFLPLSATGIIAGYLVMALANS